MRTQVGLEQENDGNGAIVTRQSLERVRLGGVEYNSADGMVVTYLPIGLGLVEAAKEIEAVQAALGDPLFVVDEIRVRS